MKAGWEEVALGEIAKVGAGNPAPKKAELDPTSSIPFVRTSDVGAIKQGTIYDSRDHISSSVNDKLKIFPKGTILFPKSGASTYLNHRVMLGIDSAVASHLAAIKANPAKADDRYLFYALTLVDARSIDQESKYPSLRLSQLKSLRISLPPLEEQRRIVAVLDAAFAKLDRARANVEANLEDAISLREKTFETKLVERGPYQYVTLEDICDDFQYGTSNRSEAQGQIPVLRMGNIQDGRIDWTDLKFSSDAEDLQKYNLKPGDVLFNRTNSAAHVGKTAIFSGARPAIFAGYLVRPHYRKDKVDGRFLCHYLNSPRARAYGRKVMSKSVNQANISAGKLKKYPFPMVSVASQIEMTKEVDIIVGKIDQLSNSLRSKLANIEVLRQSLLQRAFAGELSKKTPMSIQEAVTDEELAAAVLIYAYSKHLAEGTQKTFGRVKAQKVLSLAESVGRMELGRNPIKQAAGPHDEAHMRRVQAWAEDAGAFRFEERDGGGYTFIRGRNYDVALERARDLLGDRLQNLQRFLPLTVKMRSRQAEVLATVHAAWNNLLSDGSMPSDEDIVRASREDWHRKKLNIPRNMFFDAIALIRREGIEPDGTAKYVGGQGELSL